MAGDERGRINMGLAVVRSRTLDGLEAAPVRVEVHLANGLPCLTLVGLADTEVRESRERVRSALAHSGLGFPHNQRITVNLAPADLPKESGRFDLPIALGILAAQGVIGEKALDAFEFAGELSLAGELRPVRGALALALSLRREGLGGAPARSLVLPLECAAEAALVEGVRVLGARHLTEVVQALRGEEPGLPRIGPTGPNAAGASPPSPCLRDIRGQALGKRALEVAAAGHHSLLFIGPPGSGKSMLAQRLPGLMPPLGDEQALEVAAVASVSTGGFAPEQWRRRPWRAPHHSCSPAALVGGGCAVFLLMRQHRHNCDAKTERCQRENRAEGTPIHPGPASQYEMRPDNRPQRRVVAWRRHQERANKVSAPRSCLMPLADA